MNCGKWVNIFGTIHLEEFSLFLLVALIFNLDFPLLNLCPFCNLFAYAICVGIFMNSIEYNVVTMVDKADLTRLNAFCIDASI